MWFEGKPYKKEIIYDIHSDDPKSPPVNYFSYTLKPHSLTHLETAAHTQREGRRLDFYFDNKIYDHFWGKTTVIKLKGDKFKDHEEISGIKIWHISKEEILAALKEMNGSEKIPKRLLISLENLPLNEYGLHNPNYVLILSQDAATYLSQNSLKLYGTSWKSSDFMPKSKERPIHNTLFETALIMECLDLDKVPAGNYFLNAFPIPLEGASESPVCPVLYSKEEILEELNGEE